MTETEFITKTSNIFLHNIITILQRILPWCKIIFTCCYFHFHFFTNYFTKFIFELMCRFLKGVNVYPVPSSLNPRRSCVVVSTRRYWCSMVMVRCFQGNEVSRELGWLGEPCFAYLKMFIPASSSHGGRCTLIRCAGTRDPCMQRWVVRTKVIAILILMYPHVLE